MDDQEREGHGFRKIGDLVPKIIPGQSSTDLSGRELTPLPQSLSITGSISPVREVEKSRGGAPGAIASAPLPSVSQALTGDRPEVTDKALLASLPPSIASSLTAIEREWVDAKYGYDFEVVGYELVGLPSTDDLMQARGIFHRACKPADDGTIKAELARLRFSTKAARIDDADDMALGLSAYADAMAEYPPDIVRAACRGWARREKWFPSLAELIAELDRRARPRFGMQRALG